MRPQRPCLQRCSPPPPGHAQKNYGPGASDTEIKLGQTISYSGPLSVFGTIGRAEAAYFEKVNAEGGINGRKIKPISLDDAYAPPKTVEQTRKLVEQDEVLALFSSLGTPTNTAIHKYVNAKKVSHLFLSTGASKWGDPQQFPWTMGWAPNYRQEGTIYARYILKSYPQARIAVLYQNDDFGKDFLKGFQDGLGERSGTMIVGQATTPWASCRRPTTRTRPIPSGPTILAWPPHRSSKHGACTRVTSSRAPPSRSSPRSRR